MQGLENMVDRVVSTSLNPIFSCVILVSPIDEYGAFS